MAGRGRSSGDTHGSRPASSGAGSAADVSSDHDMLTLPSCETANVAATLIDPSATSPGAKSRVPST